MTVLVGGVSELYQGDLDLGRRAIERLGLLAAPGVQVEDLYYGAVAAAQLLEDLRPEALVLVGTAVRGRAPGAVSRRLVSRADVPAGDPAASVQAAVTGYVGVDLLVEVAAGLGALPARTVVIDAEPASCSPSPELSPEATAALGVVVDTVRAELLRLPVMWVADRLEERTGTVAPDGARPAAASEMRALLDELRRADRDGGWGATFRLRDRLRVAVADGSAGTGWQTEDWALAWSLVEALDAAQGADGSPPGD